MLILAYLDVYSNETAYVIGFGRVRASIIDYWHYSEDGFKHNSQ